MGMKVLVVGSTGLLGSEICERLVAKGHKVRAMVRPTSDPARVDLLRSLGVELVTGDLKDTKSLERACRGQEAVISTASSTFSRQPGDSIETVDRDGLENLVGAAKREHVKRFVFTSFSGHIDEPSPLRDAKRGIEKRLQESGLEYSILRPSYYMEVWLSPAVGFDFAKSTATIYGTGTNKISWISFHNVAQFAVEALEKPAFRNRLVELGGPEPLSPLEVVGAFERHTGRKFDVKHVPVETLRQQHATAPDSLGKSFAALMLDYAGGDEIPMADVLRELPVKLTTVEQYARGATVASPTK
jgi:uncharacterized protein YbjT (DUF2867 family)